MELECPPVITSRIFHSYSAYLIAFIFLNVYIPVFDLTTCLIIMTPTALGFTNYDANTMGL